jgi:hypothetical protein
MHSIRHDRSARRAARPRSRTPPRTHNIFRGGTDGCAADRVGAHYGIWCGGGIETDHAPSQLAASGAVAPSVPQGGPGGPARDGEQHRVIVNAVAGFRSGSSEAPAPAPPILAQGNGMEASIALATVPGPGGLGKCEGNPLPKRSKKIGLVNARIRLGRV